MIGQIRGTLIGRQAPEILVDVGGIGYEIQVPMTTLYQLPELGQPVTLLTHFVVREDAQQLFGFADSADRRLFRALIKVSGVGPRLALTLLSGMDAAAFARCLQRDDVAALVALPGVGRKDGGTSAWWRCVTKPGFGWMNCPRSRARHPYRGKRLPKHPISGPRRNRRLSHWVIS